MIFFDSCIPAISLFSLSFLQHQQISVNIFLSIVCLCSKVPYLLYSSPGNPVARTKMAQSNWCYPFKLRMPHFLFARALIGVRLFHFPYSLFILPTQLSVPSTLSCWYLSGQRSCSHLLTSAVAKLPCLYLCLLSYIVPQISIRSCLIFSKIFKQ